MKNIYLAALFAGTALAPAAYAQDAAQSVAGDSCERLVTFVRNTDQDTAGVTRGQADQLLADGDVAACAEALEQAQVRLTQAGMEPPEGFEADVEAEVEVDVPEPDVTVRQPDPQVVVKQPQPQIEVDPGRPQVTVNQPAPQVTVQMPQPTITIDMPPPEIEVAMPNPDVSVDLPAPEVAVQQPQPEVSIEQSEPQIAVGQNVAEGAEPQETDVSVVGGDTAEVAVQEAERARVAIGQAQPVVTYNAAEPQVRFEQAGEPTIEFNQTGEPMVQIRQMSREETRQAGQGGESANMAVNAGAAREMNLTVGDIANYDIVGANGNTFGGVEEIVNVNDRLYATVGADRPGSPWVALPLSSLVVSDNALMAPNVTQNQFEALEGFDADAYEALPDDHPITIGGM